MHRSEHISEIFSAINIVCFSLSIAQGPPINTSGLSFNLYIINPISPNGDNSRFHYLFENI